MCVCTRGRSVFGVVSCNHHQDHSWWWGSAKQRARDNMLYIKTRRATRLLMMMMMIGRKGWDTSLFHHHLLILYCSIQQLDRRLFPPTSYLFLFLVSLSPSFVFVCAGSCLFNCVWIDRLLNSSLTPLSAHNWIGALYTRTVYTYS